MQLKMLIRNNLAFFIPVLISFIAGIIFLSLFSRDDIHIAHNSWTHAWADIFFTYDTLLGEGHILAIAGILLIFVKWRYFIGFMLASLFTLLSVGVLKQVIFDDYPRPGAYFKEKYELYLVEGVEIHNNNSFPSGHTTYAFAAWGFLAFLVKRKSIKFLFFLVAVSVGYSRLYLSQHFLMDVIAGMVLGTLIATISYLMMLRIGREWAEGSIKIYRNRK